MGVGEILGQQIRPGVDFSWLGDLPATWDEAQSKAEISRALQGVDLNDPDAMSRVAQALLGSGRDKTMKVGLDLLQTAQKQRDLLLGQQQTQAIGNFLQGGGQLPVGSTESPRSFDPRGKIPLIRQKAAEYGIDPDVAVKVAMSEGLGDFYGDNGKSGGAFQLYTGGGLGNEFQRDTGLSPLDPKNEDATIDYALKRAAQGGWGPWYGARHVGIGQFEGIGKPAGGTQPAVMTDVGPSKGVQFAQAATPESPSQARARTEANQILGVIMSTTRADPAARQALMESYKNKLAETNLTEEEKNRQAFNADRALRGQSALGAEDYLKVRSGATAQGKEEAEAFAKQYSDIAASGKAGVAAMNTLDNMERVLQNPKLVTGFGAKVGIPVGQAAQTVGDLASEFGVLPKSFEPGIADIAERTGLAEQFQSSHNQLVFDMAHGKLSQGFTDKDRDFVSEILPGLQQSKPGNRAILETQRLIKQRDIDNAALANAYYRERQRTGQAPKTQELDAILNNYAKEHPLFKNADGTLTESGKKIQGQLPSPESKEAPKAPMEGRPKAPMEGRPPPPEAIKQLRESPATIREFNKIFGEGAAEAILGGSM